jgi:hypothetical protein
MRIAPSFDPKTNLETDALQRSVFESNDDAKRFAFVEPPVNQDETYRVVKQRARR